MTCGYNTRFGSGKRRAWPAKWLTSKFSSVASHGFIARLPLDFDRRQLDRRIKPNFWYQFRIQLDVWELLIARGHLREAGVKFSEKLLQIKPFACRPVLGQIAPTAAVNFAGSTDVSVPEVMQS